MGYITGEIQRPALGDSTYVNWELNNSIVMAWLINSMESYISRTYLFLRSAKAIWDAVNNNYSDLENASQVFEIKNKLKEMHQGNLEVTEYYNELQTLWQELDMHYEADWGDLEGNLKFKRHLEKERLYEFLTGLNRELDEVRGRILGRRPLPSIDEAFAEVRREASRRCVMLGGRKEAVTSGEMRMETVALATKNTSSIDKSSGDHRNNQRGGRPWCSHCNKPGHARDIHGKPSNWKSRGSNKGKGFQATIEEKNEDTRASSDTNGIYFTEAQLEQLQKLLSQPTMGNQNIATSHYAQGTALHAQNNCPWILDFGASDHMTTCNLISMSKVTHDLNCNAKFSASLCEIQERESGKTISSARVSHGLYYFEDKDCMAKQATTGAENLTEDVDLDLPIALSKGIRTCTQHPISKFVSYEKLSPTFRAFTILLSKTEIPRNIQEALADPKWRIAVQEEMGALKRNDTWEVVELPARKKTTGCKWVFTVKFNANGSVNRHKARLVVKGFTQTYGVDYQETFAPVAKLNTVGVILSLASNLDWPLQQLDVENAFLNGDLHEEVYMDCPLGFEREGMEVARSKSGITVSQRKYVLDLLRDTGGKDVDREQYQRLVGKLIYLSHTRPDIAFAVSLISQFMHSPKKKHLDAVYGVLRYLKGTPGKGLFFKREDNRMVEIYTNADWAGSSVDRRSTSGYCTYVWGNLITWRSKKQPVVARSSAEAEFRALAHDPHRGKTIRTVIMALVLLKQVMQEHEIVRESFVEKLDLLKRHSGLEARFGIGSPLEAIIRGREGRDRVLWKGSSKGQFLAEFYGNMLCGIDAVLPWYWVWRRTIPLKECFFGLGRSEKCGVSGDNLRKRISGNHRGNENVEEENLGAYGITLLIFNLSE
ncbi:hypothetical protein RJ639_044326 [Escallonia herrerae]|uniref:Reverse transcriptase Ty1/copia-type domain-containing protein n=1 Tax=Escallonia herrerae TaxID=1293975 RepID=A0AA89B0R5_9ASTE|nr:hypothetical protein RJ639_044326 [Escallonia herrerae]